MNFKKKKFEGIFKKKISMNIKFFLEKLN